MSADRLKFAGAVLLFALWAVLVYLGKADAAPLVTAIGATLAGLGIHGASNSTTIVNQEAPKAQLTESQRIAASVK